MKSERKKLLLHGCCAPCSVNSGPESAAEYDVTYFYYNPNIDVPGEYEKRRDEMIKLSSINGIPLEVGPKDTELWKERVKGLEQLPEGGERCRVCFEMRLEKTAETAELLGFDLFATTLTVAPMKNVKLINECGKKAAKGRKAEYLETCFRKKDGYRKSVELSAKYDLYRQNYCGCSFSREEAEKRRQRKKKKEEEIS